MNVEKWKNNKFIKNLKIKQYPAYPSEFIIFFMRYTILLKND